jgi:hypothetical protein
MFVMMFGCFLLSLFAIALLMISAISGQRQKIVFQAIEGALEALIINILLSPLMIMLIVTAGGTWHAFMGFSGLYVVIQLLYVMWRSSLLRRQNSWAKLKGLIAGSILIVVGVYLFIWWIQSLPWEEVFPT